MKEERIMSLAIIVVDLQKDFFVKDFRDQERAEKVKLSLVENINRLLEVGRERDIPIIFVVSSYNPDRSNWTLRMRDRNSPVCLTGTEGEGMVERLDIKPKDKIVIKTRYSGFYRTELDKILLSLSVNTLAICGINTHACVRSTIIDAFMRDYRVFLPLECVDSYDIEEHENTIHYLSNRLAKVLSLHDLIERLRNATYTFHFD
jgi:maleamate amidohydrolase